MKDFAEFKIDNPNVILYDALQGVNKTFASKLTEEDWGYLTKLVVQTNVAILRQYHKWLAENFE